MRFNPRAPRGARPGGIAEDNPYREFQSTRPTWGATVTTLKAKAESTFQSTRPTWGATLCKLHGDSHQGFQSTRPTWGATAYTLHYYRITCGFNPRAPRGARPPGEVNIIDAGMFQSTRPTWGATGCNDSA